MLLAGAALFIAGLSLSGAGYHSPHLGLELGGAGAGCALAAFALGHRWVSPILRSAVPAAGAAAPELFSGRLIGLACLAAGGAFAGIGAVLRAPDVGALGLGLAICGFLLSLLSEPAKAWRTEGSRAALQSGSVPGPPPPPTD
jgi:hypothetical protein